MTLEALLKRDGILTYKTQGSSMEPMLKAGGSLVTIRKKHPGERFHENDVVLYRAPGGQHYILHRIVSVGEHDYVMLGDNCIHYEYGIRDDDIHGLMVSFHRDGKTVRADDGDYLRYVLHTRKNEKKRIARRRALLWGKSAVKKLFFRDR